MVQLSVWAIPVLLAITLHEAAHGFVAKHCGDATAWMLGRVTLNPFKHIDPVGTIGLPLILLFMGLPMIGYAKPVPVNFNNLKNYKRDTILVALAGPGANVVLVVASIIVMYVAMLLPDVARVPLLNMAYASIYINLLIAIFNLLPLPPLDGGRVLLTVLPPQQSMALERFAPYGMILVMLLAVSGILFKILIPLMSFALGLVVPLLPAGIM